MNKLYIHSDIYHRVSASDLICSPQTANPALLTLNINQPNFPGHQCPETLRPGTTLLAGIGHHDCFGSEASDFNMKIGHLRKRMLLLKASFLSPWLLNDFP
jgi:hypothetical protein